MKQNFIQKLSKIKLIVSTLGLILFSFSAVFAQQQIRGKVTGADGDALVGVNVAIKGTAKGSTTDANGAFRI